MKTPNYSNYLTHGESPNDTGLPHDDDNQSNLDHTHAHAHNHNAMIRETNSKTLLICLILTFSFSIIEALGGYFTHSIALQSDALHMLTDAAGLLIAYIANIISKRPANVVLTFGYGKAEAIGALINCVFTLILTLGLFVEVIRRFFIPVKVHGIGLFVIALISFIINGIIAFILSKHSHSLNTKAALIHTLGDLFGSLIAIIAGIVIYYTDFWLIDPILSVIVITILITSNFNLIKRSIRVLMAGVPEHLEYEEVGRDLEKIEGIKSVHDLHIWYMTANKTALSAHIVATNPYSWPQTLLKCQKMLRDKYHIEHVTLQHEFDLSISTHYCEIQ